MLGRGVSKRIWALILSLCMIFAALGGVAFSTPAEAASDAASLLTAGDIAVSISAERLASSYSRVSAGFKAAAYTGSDVTFKTG